MSLQINSKYDPTNPYHIYYDMSAINNNLSGIPQHLVFKEVRSSAYLSCPENYFATIARFELDTTCLPVWIPQIQIGSDINKTIYSVSVSNLGNTKYEYLKYEPSDLSINPNTIPPIGLEGQDIRTTYYNVYSYQKIISMINKAFETANGALNIQNGTSFAPPFMTYDPSTSLFSLYGEHNGANVLVYDIYINNSLALLLNTFNLNFIGLNQIDNKDWILNTENLGQYNYETFDTVSGVKFIKFTQDNPSISNFNPVQSIVFSITTLPVQGTLSGKAKPFYGDFNNLTGSTETNNDNFANLLTDFVVLVSNGNNYRPTILYEPTSEYRLFDMYGSAPLYTIDLSVFWKDTFNNLRKLELRQGEKGSLKILFRRKDYNINNLFQ